MTAKKKITARATKNRLNNWLKRNRQTPVDMKLSTIEFAEQVSRKISPRHAWKSFDTKPDAMSYLMKLARALKLFSE